MSGDEHDLFGAQVEQAWHHLIGLRVGFVVTNELGREDEVPRQPSPFSHVGEEGDIAVGECGNNVPLFEARKPGHRVGPGIEAVPDLAEVVFLFFGKALYPKLSEQLFEGVAVEGVKVGPGFLATPDPIHGGGVSSAPLVGEGGPVHLEILLSAQLLAVPDYGAPPVHHGAKDIEGKRFHARSGHQTTLCTDRKPAILSTASIFSSRKVQKIMRWRTHRCGSAASSRAPLSSLTSLVKSSGSSGAAFERSLMVPFMEQRLREYV